MDKNSQQANKRRRARKVDGKFKGENTASPDLNEAWEPTPVEEALPKKESKNLVKQKVTGSSQSTAGKYSKQKDVRPTFGQVHTTYN